MKAIKEIVRKKQLSVCRRQVPLRDEPASLHGMHRGRIYERPLRPGDGPKEPCVFACEADSDAALTMQIYNLLTDEPVIFMDRPPLR